MRRKLCHAAIVSSAFLASHAHAARIVQDSLLIPVTPFSNMASRHQATNDGFRAILKNAAGDVIASGPLTMDAVIDGFRDDATRGSAYGRLVLDVKLTTSELGIGLAAGEHKGRLSICKTASAASERCQFLDGNIHPERPFQWMDKEVDFVAEKDKIKITRYHGATGEGGTPHQISLVLYHPAYAFAAPGKAFKDFQSPLVLDLDGDGRVALTDVWDEASPVSFDLEGDGQKDRTGWVDARDGFLVHDTNGNGAIDSGAEMFGEHTGHQRLPNGFLALVPFDTDHDGKVTAKDKRFGELRVWQDLNQDGVSQKEELRSLEKAAVTVLNLGYDATKDERHPVDVFGNEVRLAGSYEHANGETRLMADVWFKQRRFAGMSDEQKREAQVPKPSIPTGDYGSSVSNRRAIASISDFTQARTYANEGSYLAPTLNALKPGMSVLFSASYGIGGEAGQARGVLVEENNGLHYKQLANPTGQLMLPPGTWEMTSYIDLINRISFASQGPVYGGLAASLVDFRGGTAGRSVEYKDVLELTLALDSYGDAKSQVSVYYAKGIGPVGMEFREASSPGGTFKVYIGDLAN